jgi:hypothetical protein
MAETETIKMTPFEQEVIRLLTENNRLLNENHKLLVSLDETAKKIKANTN